MKKLVFNNIQAESIGFIVVEGPPETLAQEDYEVVNIEGRNGSLVINKGTYPDVAKTFTITAIDYIEDDDIEGMIDNIKRWLFDYADNKLFYAYSNKYNIVKKVIFDEDIRTSFEEFGDFQVTFLCDPFYYKDENKVIITKSENETIERILTNDGDFESFPYIKIYGTGNVYFHLNHTLIAIKNITTYVEIDTKLLTCLDANGNNKINDFISEFPTFNKGTNLIQIPPDQNITRIEIVPRTIYR